MAGACSSSCAGSAKAAKTLADQLPSLKSKDYGKPFADIFAAVKGDFYAIDRMLFSPAKVTVTALESRRELRGRPYRHGDPVPLLLLLTSHGGRNRPVLRAQEMARAQHLAGACARGASGR